MFLNVGLLAWSLLSFYSGCFQVVSFELPNLNLKPVQLLWWNFAFKKLVDSADQTVASYQKIAAAEAIAFMDGDAVKPYL